MGDYTPTGTGTGVGTSTAYTNYCSSRLPCGICRLTNAICPMWNSSVMPTWSPMYEVTCSAELKGEEDEVN